MWLWTAVKTAIAAKVPDLLAKTPRAAKKAWRWIKRKVGKDDQDPPTGTGQSADDGTRFYRPDRPRVA